jgi:amidase
MMPLNQLSATEFAELSERGHVCSRDLVQACLSRIREREAQRRAWAHIDAAAVTAAAQAADAAPSEGALHGIPVGIKDVFDTCDFPTQMGSSIYTDWRPLADASVVALLRRAGAVIMGKTVTAEFAGMAATHTTNPNDGDRTPGGSSSGSAAAVADAMVPIAIGTQTGGSVLRPASYCGVFGFKPTYGRISRTGLKAAAESLDTVGWMARSLADIDRVHGVLTGAPHRSLTEVQPKRIGVCQTHLWNTALPETHVAVAAAARRLGDQGVEVAPFSWPAEFAQLSTEREIINDYERAQALCYEWTRHRDQISPQLSAAIQRGLGISSARHIEALRLAERARVRLDTLLEDYDALIAPCVQGEAPLGLAYSGDPRLQAIWTLLHVPTIGLPTHRGPNNLPVSIQIVGPRYGDSRLLQVALGIWHILGTAALTNQQDLT